MNVDTPFRHRIYSRNEVFTIATEVDVTSAQQSIFVTAHIHIKGKSGGIFGRAGAGASISGELTAPSNDVVLWRVMERVDIDRNVTERTISPADDCRSVAYEFHVGGGEGGLFPIDEPGEYKADLIAVFAPPSYLPTLGSVEVLTTNSNCHVDKDTPRKPPIFSKKSSSSPRQMEGRLFRYEDDPKETVYFGENGTKRPLASPTCGKLRFGDGWRRLIQSAAHDQKPEDIPTGPPLTVAETAEGKRVSCWPDPEAYFVRHGQKRKIEDPDAMVPAFGPHWRTKLIYLRRDDIDAIPDGQPINTAADLAAEAPK